MSGICVVDGGEEGSVIAEAVAVAVCRVVTLASLNCQQTRRP